MPAVLLVFRSFVVDSCYRIRFKLMVLIVVVVVYLRIHTILKATKQTQASVNRVHRSIEDCLLSSQEITQKVLHSGIFYF